MFQNHMTRRQLLALAALALPCSGELLLAAQASPKPRKKGLCLSAKTRSPERVAQFLKAVNSRWIYNWNIAAPKILPAGVDFVPMVYQGRTVTKQLMSEAKSQARKKGGKELLGFNEPDAPTQGNTSVEEALDAWPVLESAGLRLGSPATVHPDNEWMVAFMKGAKARGLRIDFVCMHSYGGPGVEGLLKKIEKIHDMYKLPIWITEFAVADWDAKTASENRHKPEKIAEFVSQLLPKLEAMEIVERYAWFHGGVSGGPLATSKLFNADGSLTIVGKAYRSVG
ncbi:MAG: glycosyl hydrolase [Luteolibacter sp.]